MNVAARLEQAARPGEILVGEQTYLLTRDAVSFEPVESLALKENRSRSPPISCARWRTTGRPTPGGATSSSSTERRSSRHSRRSLPRAWQSGAVAWSRSSGRRALASPSRRGVRSLGGIGLDGSEWALPLLRRGDHLLAARRGREEAAAVDASDTPDRARRVSPSSRPPDRTARRSPGCSPSQQGSVRRGPLPKRSPGRRGSCWRPWPASGPSSSSSTTCSGRSRRSSPSSTRSPGSRPPSFFSRSPGQSFPSWTAMTRRSSSGSSRSPRMPRQRSSTERSPAGSRDLRDHVIEAAGGNPLFLEELLAMLIDSGVVRRSDGGWISAVDESGVPLPPTLEALLESRLDLLDEVEREVMERGSVEGKVFRFETIEALSVPGELERLRAALDALADKGLVHHTIHAGEPAFLFRHLLVRDVVYRGFRRGSARSSTSASPVARRNSRRKDGRDRRGHRLPLRAGVLLPARARGARRRRRRHCPEGSGTARAGFRALARRSSLRGYQPPATRGRSSSGRGPRPRAAPPGARGALTEAGRLSRQPRSSLRRAADRRRRRRATRGPGADRGARLAPPGRGGESYGGGPRGRRACATEFRGGRRRARALSPRAYLQGQVHWLRGRAAAAEEAWEREPPPMLGGRATSAASRTSCGGSPLPCSSARRPRPRASGAVRRSGGSCAVICGPRARSSRLWAGSMR